MFGRICTFYCFYLLYYGREQRCWIKNSLAIWNFKVYYRNSFFNKLNLYIFQSISIIAVTLFTASSRQQRSVENWSVLMQALWLYCGAAVEVPPSFPLCQSKCCPLLLWWRAARRGDTVWALIRKNNSAGRTRTHARPCTCRSHCLCSRENASHSFYVSFRHKIKECFIFRLVLAVAQFT